MAFENLKRLTFTQLTSSFKTRDAFGMIHDYLQEFMCQEEIEEELKYREETITK